MEVDPRTFRQTVGQFLTGVTVIAVETEGNLRAMTANSFASLSLHPPTVLFCAGMGTKLGRLLSSAKGFSVNILRHDQQALSTYFAGAWKQSPPPPFRFVSWQGGPRLEGSAAALGCSLESLLECGDHWIVVGRVIALHLGVGPRHPLAFFEGCYGSFQTSAEPAPDLQAVEQPILAYYDPWEGG
jgi:flavin reductase (DIM6/NTAB) family NADH-FMN oxidoreductase RutF